MEEFKDLYAVLGVTSAAPHEVIRAAYRAMARLHHPDVNKRGVNEPSMMAYINKAYEILSCPQRRREYDLSLNQANRLSATKSAHEYRGVHTSFDYPATVLTTYDHRGRLRAYA
jgi:DnaJ-class molecular chaperone